MNFFDKLKASTEPERQYLLSAPIMNRCFEGDITLPDYASFLSQAYHHVKHTVPLLMAVGARLPEDREWLREAVAEYIDEELGHQEWILDDIQACGYNREKARRTQPNFETEVMVAYAYDVVQRTNPVGFFGMVHVLEGTSIATADRAAEAIQNQLRLPDTAFRYLRSHGALDQQHVVFFEKLMNRIVDPNEQTHIIRCTKIFYRLYGNMFRGLNPEQAEQIAA